ncbi:MAG: hypothetical protein ACJAVK_003091 [Akkermansiaceae bacterium]|jgi:hypothetical protein
MKSILLASLLCLVLGFVLGRLGEREEQAPEGEPVTRSERRAGARGGHGTGARSAGGGMKELARLAVRAQAFPDNQLAETRLKAWILQLELAQIPEALDYIAEKDRREGTDWVSEEMMMLLTRWYELEGEGVFSWIRAQEGWEEGDFSEAEAIMIVDGFHRDPQRGLELALELIDCARGKDSFRAGRISVLEFQQEVLYEVGAWGLDPILMLGRLDPEGELRRGYHIPGVGGMSPQLGQGTRFPGSLGNGFPETPGEWSGFSSNPEMKALAKGLLDSGREEFARQLMNDLEGGAREAIEEVVGERAAESGWLKVKELIDQGTLSATWERSFKILDGMAQVNREEALDWFVSLDQDEEVSREERIRWAAASGGAFEISQPPSDDPFADKTRYDRESARDWLDEMEARGEPVHRARMSQFREAIQQSDWEWVRRDRKHFSVVEWGQFEDLLVTKAVILKSETVSGEEISWASFNESSSWVEAGREFGLLERVEAVVEERNREARAQLRSIVEKIEVEGGQ